MARGTVVRRSRWFPQKEEVVARHGLVTAMDPRAAGVGVEASWPLTLAIANHADILRRFPATASLFLPTGVPLRSWPQSDRLVQRDLAGVLRLIARHGPDAFYRGEVAEAIEEDMRRNGGLITREDLAEYQAVVRPPRQVPYRGYTLQVADLHHGGITLAQTVRILEHVDLRALGHNTPAYLHTFIEAARHAFADRYHYLGDPESVPVPLDGLLSPAYARTLAGLVAPERAGVEPLLEEEPWAFFATRPLHDPWPYEGHSRPPGPSGGGIGAGDECTTHFNVVDGERTVVVCTQTAVSVFGSGVVTPGLGILWNNGMVWFNPRPGTVNSIAPGKRPLTNMAPVLVLREGRPLLGMGAPGGRRIINANAQVLLNVLEFGMTPQQAVAQPRVDASTRTTLVDARLDPGVAEALAQMGHRIQVVEETPGTSHFARPSAVMVEPETGLLRAGVDAFHTAEAQGWEASGLTVCGSGGGGAGPGARG